jgi:hypothetical protein
MSAPTFYFENKDECLQKKFQEAKYYFVLKKNVVFYDFFLKFSVTNRVSSRYMYRNASI